VQLRPRKKAAKRSTAKSSAGSSRTGARRGRPPKRAASASGSATSAARQLSDAAQALVAHITRLESELEDARKDSQRLADIERALGRR
jgi:hypothetical protein